MALTGQEVRVVGFLEVPQLFPGWSTEWEPLHPDADFELPLRRDPSPGSEVVTHLTPAFDGFLARTPGGEERVAIPPDTRRAIVGTLEARTSRMLVVLEPGEDPDEVRQRLRGGRYHVSSIGEGGGTHGGVLVFDTLPGWFEVALRHFEWREAPRVWLQEGSDWTFHPVRSEDEARESTDRAFGREVISVQVLGFQRVGGDLWANVEVHADSWCLAGGDPEVVAEGWIRVHADSGAPAVWFYSRGC
jgi:hypothetical protein